MFACIIWKTRESSVDPLPEFYSDIYIFLALLWEFIVRVSKQANKVSNKGNPIMRNQEDRKSNKHKKVQNKS